MRVKVSEVTGPYADSYEGGLRLADVIAPVLARGEEVVLDFDGVKEYFGAYFDCAIGRLIVQDADDRLPGLLRYENLSPVGRLVLEGVTEHAIRRRENPRWATGYDEAVQKRSREAWE
jgi:hypothetical protein